MGEVHKKGWIQRMTDSGYVNEILNLDRKLQ